MNKVILLALLAILATSQGCRQGQLNLEGVGCQDCGFIEGCAQYVRDGRCGACGFGTLIYYLRLRTRQRQV